MADLVLTLIGRDRPGLVEAVAERVNAHGGNWLESRMAQLAGHFAGLLHVELPDESVASLQSALAELEGLGLRVVAHGGTARLPERPRTVRLEATGHDRPGIVRDISQVLVRHGVNIAELTTDRLSAPMAGGPLFVAKARLDVPAGLDPERLRQDLETIAHDLMVDLSLAVEL